MQLDITDKGSFEPWVGKSLGGGHGNPLRCYCLENPMDRGAWWATVHSVAKNQTRLKWLSKHVHVAKCLKEGLGKCKFGNLCIFLIFFHIFQPPALISHDPFPDTHGLAVCPGIPSWNNALAHLVSPGCFLAKLWVSAPLEGIPEASYLVSCFSSGAPQFPVLLAIIMLTLCIIMVCWCICIPHSQTGSFAKLGSMSYSWLSLQAWGRVLTQ